MILFKVLYRYQTSKQFRSIATGAIIAPNHTSYLDPPFIAASWGMQPIHFLAKASLFKGNTCFRWLITTLNAHPVEIDHSVHQQAFKTIVRLLKQNKKVLVFPEGARSHDGCLLPLKTGVAYLSYLSGCPIIPCHIEGMFDIWPVHEKRPRLKGRLASIFGKPIDPAQFRHLSKKEAIVAIHKTLEEAMIELSYTRAKPTIHS